ncbi:MAG: DUF3560 domain-containing protein [Gammaproteobacteria bacterium]|nr:DUF3560 domain-containing protein [Gammaproteobacteria bacterium]
MNYEAKKAARIEHMRERAERAEKASESAYNKSREISEHIPMGQPILVGHHSEKRHRSDLKKIDNAMRKAVDESNKAKDLERRANAAEDNNSVSSDDPQAITKLKEKLRKLECLQVYMKEINKCWRKSGKPKADDKEGWDKIKASLVISDTEIDKARVNMAHDFMDRAPYPPYALTNNGGNMKRIEERIRDLESRKDLEERTEIISGVEVYHNVDENRLQLIFDGKPDSDMRQQLKSNGFRWSPTNQAWQRQLTNVAIACATRLLSK